MEKNDIEKKLHAGGITDEEENFAINVSSLITKDVNTVLVSAIGKAGVTFCYWSEPVVIHKSEIPAPVKIFKPDFALTDER